MLLKEGCVARAELVKEERKGSGADDCINQHCCDL